MNENEGLVPNDAVTYREKKSGQISGKKLQNKFPQKVQIVENNGHDYSFYTDPLFQDNKC